MSRFKVHNKFAIKFKSNGNVCKYWALVNLALAKFWTSQNLTWATEECKWGKTSDCYVHSGNNHLAIAYKRMMSLWIGRRWL